MKSLVLIHINEKPEAMQPAHIVAIALSPNGALYWGNAACISRKCDHPDEWNAEIDRLREMLDDLRHEGLSKLRANHRRTASPRPFTQKSLKRKQTKR